MPVVQKIQLQAYRAPASSMGMLERAIRTVRVADHCPGDRLGNVSDGDQPARKNHS
jgi:hypothetical protein